MVSNHWDAIGSEEEAMEVERKRNLLEKDEGDVFGEEDASNVHEQSRAQLL